MIITMSCHLVISTVDAGTASWSPDGSKIVLQRQGSGEYAIWVMNADGSGLVRLTSELYDNSDPTFAPDGKHILYASQKGGYSAIWLPGGQIDSLDRSRRSSGPRRRCR
jgi:Tol biopolymer transport system component